ncbi:uncharacterized protein LOC143239963 [Tachypleus tridentatus]|uniref:uncharacterized protein LOC143239963 n=1 Tax=Tachypleus tridentatus TaxID=6853 RepID=UPI003FD68743
MESIGPNDGSEEISSAGEAIQEQVLGFLQVQSSDSSLQVTGESEVIYLPPQIELDGEHVFLTQENGEEIILLVNASQGEDLDPASGCDYTICSSSEHTNQNLSSVSKLPIALDTSLTGMGTTVLVEIPSQSEGEKDCTSTYEMPSKSETGVVLKDENTYFIAQDFASTSHSSLKQKPSGSENLRMEKIEANPTGVLNKNSEETQKNIIKGFVSSFTPVFDEEKVQINTVPTDMLTKNENFKQVVMEEDGSLCKPVAAVSRELSENCITPDKLYNSSFEEVNVKDMYSKKDLQPCSSTLSEFETSEVKSVLGKTKSTNVKSPSLLGRPIIVKIERADSPIKSDATSTEKSEIPDQDLFHIAVDMEVEERKNPLENMKKIQSVDFSSESEDLVCLNKNPWEVKPLESPPYITKHGKIESNEECGALDKNVCEIKSPDVEKRGTEISVPLVLPSGTPKLQTVNINENNSYNKEIMKGKHDTQEYENDTLKVLDHMSEKTFISTGETGNKQLQDFNTKSKQEDSGVCEAVLPKASGSINIEHIVSKTKCEQEHLRVQDSQLSDSKVSAFQTKYDIKSGTTQASVPANAKVSISTEEHDSENGTTSGNKVITSKEDCDLTEKVTQLLGSSDIKISTTVVESDQEDIITSISNLNYSKDSSSVEKFNKDEQGFHASGPFNIHNTTFKEECHQNKTSTQSDDQIPTFKKQSDQESFIQKALSFSNEQISEEKCEKDDMDAQLCSTNEIQVLVSPEKHAKKEIVPKSCDSSAVQSLTLKNDFHQQNTDQNSVGTDIQLSVSTKEINIENVSVQNLSASDTLFKDIVKDTEDNQHATKNIVSFFTHDDSTSSIDNNAILTEIKWSAGTCMKECLQITDTDVDGSGRKKGDFEGTEEETDTEHKLHTTKKGESKSQTSVALESDSDIQVERKKSECNLIGNAERESSESKFLPIDQVYESCMETDGESDTLVASKDREHKTILNDQTLESNDQVEVNDESETITEDKEPQTVNQRLIHDSSITDEKSPQMFENSVLDNMEEILDDKKSVEISLNNHERNKTSYIIGLKTFNLRSSTKKVENASESMSCAVTSIPVSYPEQGDGNEGEKIEDDEAIIDPLNNSFREQEVRNESGSEGDKMKEKKNKISEDNAEHKKKRGRKVKQKDSADGCELEDVVSKKQRKVEKSSEPLITSGLYKVRKQSKKNFSELLEERWAELTGKELPHSKAKKRTKNYELTKSKKVKGDIKQKSMLKKGKESTVSVEEGRKQQQSLVINPNKEYDIRIRYQNSPPPKSLIYNCFDCGFSTSRLCNLIYHYKAQCPSSVQKEFLSMEKETVQEKLQSRFGAERVDAQKGPSGNMISTVSTSNKTAKKDTKRKLFSPNKSEKKSNVDIRRKPQVLNGVQEDEVEIDIEEDSDNDMSSACDTPIKNAFGFDKDDIVWVYNKKLYWPAVVRRVYPKLKKVSVRFIGLSQVSSGIRVSVKKVNTFDNAEKNKKYLSLPQLPEDSAALLKAVQQAEDFLRKRCLGYKVNARQFFGTQEEDSLSEVGSTVSGTGGDNSMDSKVSERLSPSLQCSFPSHHQKKRLLVQKLKRVLKISLNSERKVKGKRT